MNSNNQSLAHSRPEITSTAFRLPTQLLQVIDRWCAKNDVTRSQFFRRSIMDRVNSLGIGSPTELDADQLRSAGAISQLSFPGKSLLSGPPKLTEDLNEDVDCR